MPTSRHRSGSVLALSLATSQLSAATDTVALEQDT